MRKFITIALLFLIVVTTPVYSQVDLTEINFSNVTSNRFDRNLRGWFGKVNEDVLKAGLVDPSGRVFFVDGNKSSAGKGSSWDDAFNTFAAAVTASNADIATKAYRKWAARNTIFVIGDDLIEDITVLPSKCDVRGLGSNDAYGKASFDGTWIIPSTAASMGCHFYNCMFTETGATMIFDVDGQYGLEFHGCLFDGAPATTGGILASECNWMVVNGCEFSAVAATRQFDTYAIKVENDTNAIYGVKIINNIIQTAGIGLDFDETAAYNCYANGNVFMTDGMCIDSEDIAGLMVIGNRMITTLGEADNTSNDFNILYAIDNIVTGGTGTLYIPSPADF